MMLEARDLTVAVGGRTLIAGLSLRFQPGESWAVLGPNGSGKSLLLHTLAGLRTPAGEICVGGDRLGALAPRERSRRISLLLQEQSEAATVTVIEMLLAARYAHTPAWGWETEVDLACARAALANTDLAGYENRRLETLSGGERRRCMIAAMLARQTPVSLWDEPTNHLDMRHQVTILDLLKQRAKQGAVNVCVLHDVNLATRFCSHALLVYGDGRYEAGGMQSVLTENNLSALYGCPVRRMSATGGVFYLPG